MYYHKLQVVRARDASPHALKERALTCETIHIGIFKFNLNVAKTKAIVCKTLVEWFCHSLLR